MLSPDHRRAFKVSEASSFAEGSWWWRWAAGIAIEAVIRATLDGFVRETSKIASERKLE